MAFRMAIRTFIFLDIETTGLPALECHKTKITELSLIAVQADHLFCGCFPRVLNKLNLFFNPNRLISQEAEKITGLSNVLLENQIDFNKDSANLIKDFLNIFGKPICLVAHNGYNFDFPILKSELKKCSSELPTDILCVDSIVAFKYIDENNTNCESIEDNRINLNEPILTFSQSIQKQNETTPEKQIYNPQNHIGSPKKRTKISYKLVDVFKRLTLKDPIYQHQAEGDVRMLIHCSAVYAEKFVDYANNNFKYFDDVPLMEHHKRIL